MFACHVVMTLTNITDNRLYSAGDMYSLQDVFGAARVVRGSLINKHSCRLPSEFGHGAQRPGWASTVRQRCPPGLLLDCMPPETTTGACVHTAPGAGWCMSWAAQFTAPLLTWALVRASAAQR